MDPATIRFCIYFALAGIAIMIVMLGVLALVALERHLYANAAVFGFVVAFLIYSFRFLYSQTKGIWI